MGIIVKNYKESFLQRFDKDEAIPYYSTEDFPGLKCEQGSFKNSSGVIIHYFIYNYDNYNQNKLILFCPGIGPGHTAYFAEINTLCKAGYRILTLDYTGCGESKGKCLKSLNEPTRDVEDLLKHLQIHVPIVLVGMGTANKRLQRHKHLYDRLLEIIKFEPFSKQDISSIIDQLSEVPFTDCAKKLLYTRTNRFRQLVKTISKAEQVAKSNGIKEIDEITLKEVLKNDDADAEEIELTNENS